MLYYTPQIWCSDNTDAIDRIRIQEGTSYAYPILAVSAHVSAVPNHQTGRTTSIQTRGIVAMSGSFGYELDLGKITEEEYVKHQIESFYKYWGLIHNGDYYRLTSTLKDTQLMAWEFTARDKSESLLNVITLDTHGNASTQYIKCKGLNPDVNYIMEGTEMVYSGKALMSAGIPIPYMTGEYQSWQFYFCSITVT